MPDRAGKAQETARLGRGIPQNRGPVRKGKFWGTCAEVQVILRKGSSQVGDSQSSRKAPAGDQQLKREVKIAAISASSHVCAHAGNRQPVHRPDFA